MPTIFSHAVVGAAIGAVMLPRAVGMKPLWLGVAGTVIPDLDVLAFSLGMAYDHPLGHRGATHSLMFALLLAGVVSWMHRRDVAWQAHRYRLWVFLALCVASHGVLDAFTNGGLGVAFFWPLDSARHFFPFTPIEVSPIGASFFSWRGWITLRSELLWILAPAGAVILGAKAWRYLAARRRH